MDAAFTASIQAGGDPLLDAAVLHLERARAVQASRQDQPSIVLRRPLNMPLAITSQPAGPQFAITADAQMPTITVTAVLQNEALLQGARPSSNGRPR